MNSETLGKNGNGLSHFLLLVPIFNRWLFVLLVTMLDIIALAIGMVFLLVVIPVSFAIYPQSNPFSGLDIARMSIWAVLALVYAGAGLVGFIRKKEPDFTPHGLVVKDRVAFWWEDIFDFYSSKKYVIPVHKKHLHR